MELTFVIVLITICSVVLVITSSQVIQLDQSHKRTLKASPITNKDVVIQISVTLLALKYVLKNLTISNQNAIQAQSIATLAYTQATNSSLLTTMISQQQISLTSLQTALMSAQADVQIAQAALSQALMYHVIYDSLISTATLAQSTQQLASQTSTGDDQAGLINLAVTQSLLFQIVVETQINLQIVNTTPTIKPNSTGPNIFTTTALKITKEALNFTQSQQELMKTLLVLAQKAQASSLTQNSPPNSASRPVYNQAVSSLQADALAAVIVIGAESNIAVMTAQDRLQSALIAQQTAFNTYLNYSAVVAIDAQNIVEAVYVANRSLNDSSISATLSANESRDTVMSMSRTMNSIKSSSILAGQREQQSASQCLKATSKAADAIKSKAIACDVIIQTTSSDKCNLAQTEVIQRVDLRFIACQV